MSEIALEHGGTNDKFVGDAQGRSGVPFNHIWPGSVISIVWRQFGFRERRRRPMRELLCPPHILAHCHLDRRRREEPTVRRRAALWRPFVSAV